MIFESFEADTEEQPSLFLKRLVRRNCAKSLQENKVQALVLGKHHVGKTSLVSRLKRQNLIEDTNRENANATAKGIGIIIELVELEEDLNPNTKRFEIESAHAYILMYSATDPKSYDAIVGYMREIAKIRGPGMPMVIVRNKVDRSKKNVDLLKSVRVNGNLVPHVNASVKEDKNIESIYGKLFEHQTLSKLLDIVLKINSLSVISDLGRLLQQAEIVERTVTSLFSNIVVNNGRRRFSVF